jgi:hypothetical protein
MCGGEKRGYHHEGWRYAPIFVDEHFLIGQLCR